MTFNIQWVEALTALSICYVAVENLLTDRLHAWRPLVVFSFGLLHGIGFASVLAWVMPTWFFKAHWYRRWIATPACLLIAATGGWWLAERAFL